MTSVPVAEGNGAGPGPLIVACLSHTDPRPEADPVTGAITGSRHGQGASPAEFAALETALRVAAAWHGRVLAVTAGPAAADATLREAVAVGARALRVEWADAGLAGELAGDEQPLAAAVATAIAPAGPRLVVCGDRSAGRGTGAFPAFLAHLLGASQALGLVSLEPGDGHLLAQRRLPGGRRELLRVPVPAVCSVEAAGVRLRRAPLPAVLAAGQAAIPVVTPARQQGPAVRTGTPRPYRPRARVVPPAPTGTARERLLALTGALDQREPPTVVGPLSAAEAATELLAYLHRAGQHRAGYAAPGEDR